MFNCKKLLGLKTMNTNTTTDINQISLQDSKKEITLTTLKGGLIEKQKEFEACQDQIIKLQELQRKLDSEIKERESKIQDLSRARSNYERFYTISSQQFNDAENLVTQNLEFAKSVLKEKVSWIDNLVFETDNKLETEEEIVKEALKKSENSKSVWKQVEVDAQLKQVDYERKKNPPKETEVLLKELLSLLDQAKKAEVQKSHAILYFLMIEAKRILDSIHIESVDVYIESLMSIQNELEKLKQEMVFKKEKADEDANYYKEIKEKYELKKINRRQSLLDVLKLKG